MPKVELIFFSSCPNVNRAREVLRAAHFDKFTEVNQDDLEENNPYLQYSSPTVLIDGQIIAGSKSSSAACSFIDWTSVSLNLARLSYF
jgi:hypothetical protein